jgi:hypothetical protein
MRLNSDVQLGMVSRDHLEFTYTKIKSEVNGTLLKRVGEAQSRRVEEGPVEDGERTGPRQKCATTSCPGGRCIRRCKHIVFGETFCRSKRK